MSPVTPKARRKSLSESAGCCGFWPQRSIKLVVYRIKVLSLSAYLIGQRLAIKVDIWHLPEFSKKCNRIVHPMSRSTFPSEEYSRIAGPTCNWLDVDKALGTLSQKMSPLNYFAIYHFRYYLKHLHHSTKDEKFKRATDQRIKISRKKIWNCSVLGEGVF